MLTLKKITVYPVKSFRGLDLASAVTERRGLRFDRRWMLIDRKNRFISQREFPQMAVLQAFPIRDGIRIVFPDGREYLNFLSESEATSETVTIWDSRVRGLISSGPINSALSEFIGTECRLVYMPDEVERNVDHEFGSENDIVSFADSFPYLMIGNESLDELNRRMATPLPMERFRPNLVFEGGEPFCEDGWWRIKIGDVNFRLVKPCVRCSVTTVDQTNGERVGPEPLRTLAEFRRVGKGVIFGQNMLAENPGQMIRVGDEIAVLE